VAKVGVALYRGSVERGLQQLVDAIPAVVVHWWSGRASDYIGGLLPFFG
jgi:hypothetical protein